MTNTLQFSVDLIREKQARLDNARLVLKKEFVGIDEVIDSVIDSLTTWFLFPELQERPLICNLWGMTGVGKTALVVRLSHLLDYNKKFFRFDMGNNIKNASSLKDVLKMLFRNNNGKPYMLLMDEFQYARTKNELENEIDNPYSRVLWDLLDSGKFQSFRNADSDIEMFTSCKTFLQQCLKEGVVVENNCVNENVDIFLELLENHPSDDMPFEDPVANHCIIANGITSYNFLPKPLMKELFKYFHNKSISIIEFKKMIGSMNGLAIIDLVEKVIENGTSNKWIDCSKTVIFILGNLDDAYKMSSSFNPDISADDFHEASKYININHIKRALKKRFKNEQIARLGNNHIIYPAFSQETYRKLINLELDKIAATYFEKFGLHFSFTESFKNIIYQEGVYPTQGTRPLFSTIYQFVNTKVPMLISENMLKGLDADKIVFDYAKSQSVFLFFKETKFLHKMQVNLQLNLEKLREPDQDDMQAITAVHESGHAVVSIVGSKVLPDYICSTSADTDAAGFIIIKNKLKYFSKEEGVVKIAEFFGGLMAEKLVFGADKITRGSEQDIERASELATKIIKDYGMGNTLASIDLYGPGSRHSLLDKENACNAEVKRLLEEGKQLAETILFEEEKLLLHLAHYLCDERIIKKEAIAEHARLYGSDKLKNMKFIEDGDLLFYRNHLKSLVQNLSSDTSRKIAEESVISLNRGKE